MADNESGHSMIRILTFSLSLYWLAFFGGHAVAALMAGQHGEGGASLLLNSGFPGVHDIVSGSVATILGYACIYLLAAALFLWLLLTSFLPGAAQTEQFRSIANSAFSFAGFVLALMIAAASFNPSVELFQSISLHMAGLAGSYVAISIEWLTDPYGDSDADTADVARIKALQATHSVLLSRISGRDPASPKELG